MKDSCVIDCNQCFHNDICKVKEEFEKFTKPEFPDYIRFDFSCAYFSSRKTSCRKVPNFYSNTECSSCAHEKICNRMHFYQEAKNLLKCNKKMFEYIGIALTCAFYEQKEKELKDEEE